MNKKEMQRLDQLVRQGIIPVEKQSILLKAMASLYNGRQLAPTERNILSKYMHNMTDIVLKDTTVFNRAKLHTQKTKYRTEENAVEIDEKVKVFDGPEDLERFRKGEEEKAKRKTKGARTKFRNLPPELRKEKMKAFNEDYSQRIELALEYYGFESIRDLPAELKSEFFQVVDEAAHIEIEEDVADEETEVEEAYDINGKQVRSVDRPNYVSKDVSAGKRRARFVAKAKSKAKKAMYREDTKVDEAMSPEFKAKRLEMIRKAAEKVQGGGNAAAAAAKKDAKRDINKEGMDPQFKAKRLEMIRKAAQKIQGSDNSAASAAKKDAKRDIKNEERDQQLQELRGMIKEGNNKLGAYKLLSQILNKDTGEH